ncbi:Ca-activated chloride channel family protein [Paenibacillus sp. UNCCL117]|uniref:vWA domain-containing protein n=1 Tax=unclassified Paenibacillus TaxID=185978 RepID=UPI000891BB95|nr:MULTISPECIES: vWA domain-containing protein [unclassified Paenibacillus]SDD59245.1 Ca-activated chloride channel family protein [Paenibacillus sp. cl123]SFW50851.1 Ca-activated chloride channel family protein [Paenibacillus sp. UNCCL117]
MKRRKWNGLLVALGLAGGLAGYAAGEWMLDRLTGSVHETVLMGLYFGVFALFVAAGCLLAETLSPRLNGANWKLRYAADGWKWLVPASLLLLFAGGALFQWLYGLELGRKSAPRDYVLLLDTSESMKQNDPDNQSRKAAALLVTGMSGDKRAGVAIFNEDTTWLQPLTSLRDAASRQLIADKLTGAPEPVGQTDIGKALGQAMEQMKSSGTQEGRGAVILISDGYSEMNLAEVTAPYVAQRYGIYTVGLDSAGNEQGNRLLQQLAEATGGTYRKVQDAEGISEAIGTIYANQQHWHLLGERTGAAEDSMFRAALRVMALLLLGGLLGLALGIVFDNRFLAKSFLLGGLIAGLLAGWALESGLPSMEPAFVRAIADLALVLLLTLSTVLFAVKENGGGAGLSPFRRGGYGRLPERTDGAPASRTGKRFR